MRIKGRPISIIGAAKSGLAAAKCLNELGAKVFLSDIQSFARLKPIIEEFGLSSTVEIESGGHTEKVLQADFIVLSPGVPLDIPILRKAKELGIPVHSEIEIAYRLSKGRRLVVTGSNGKTTTTTLLAKFCETSFSKVFLGGNIGIPMMEFAAETKESDLQVLEVSSFQLETISSFTPDIGIVTNFFENHLDRYPSFEAYCQAKERIALNMDGEKWLILNSDQPSMEKFSNHVKCRVAWFGWDIKDRFPAVTVKDGNFIFRDSDKKSRVLFPEKSIKIIGRHNRENIMAAALGALLIGVDASEFEKVVMDFPGVEHRVEWVRNWNGISFINDSKGTNCAASIIALKACNPPIILIAGGRDKGTDLSEWVDMLRERAKGVVIYGEAKERFRAALEGFVSLRVAASFDEAVQMASAWGTAGDTVLLSPACSSYDLFPNFEVRGRTFKELVRKLK